VNKLEGGGADNKLLVDDTCLEVGACNNSSVAESGDQGWQMSFRPGRYEPRQSPERVRRVKRDAVMNMPVLYICVVRSWVWGGGRGRVNGR